ncbi:four helix bundle protein [Patescibacteria group bacterium]|nr:four helix bundle protein [Patescibacteria group bacterium]MBU4512741.1 four helix bundle protein [Patescibacteria group bacterium]MCG2693081.1 four helix bundle protein [Candidatus Parcubacteria bacterium]
MFSHRWSVRYTPPDGSRLYLEPICADTHNGNLGAELQQIIWQILDEIIKTNSLPDSEKGEGIEKISQLFDKFKIRFRLAYEIGLITSKKFSQAQREMEEIGRMIGGWSRWSASQPTR